MSNVPPEAPTINNLEDNTKFEPSTTLDINWTFNDPNAGSQGAYRIQYTDSDNFTEPLYDSGKILSSNESQEVTFPAVLGEYYIRFRTWDPLDSEGPWTELLGFEVASATTSPGWNPPASSTPTDSGATQATSPISNAVTPSPDYMNLGIVVIVFSAVVGVVFKPLNDRKNDAVKNFREQRKKGAKPKESDKNRNEVNAFKRRRRKNG